MEISERTNGMQRHQDRDLRAAVEPAFGFVEICLTEADPRAIPNDDRPQPNGTDGCRQPVQDPCTDHGSDRRSDDHAANPGVAAGGRVARQAKDDLGGNRREDVLQRNEQRNAEIAEGVKHISCPLRQTVEHR
jgi:hypothetical protein